MAEPADSDGGSFQLSPEEERQFRLAQNDPNVIASRFPKARIRLGTFSVVCFIANRMIGTGIYNSPGSVISGTQSVAVTLLLWFLGAINAIAVASLYIEFGTTIPRYNLHGTEIPVPRNGGELNYLNYLLEKPTFFATCLFGVTFVLLGMTAGNAIAFGQNVLISSPDIASRNAAVRGIAISIITICCLLHGSWRRGGILLNNFIASIKVLAIVIFPILAICAAAGVGPPNPAKSNMSAQTSFSGAHPDMFGWSNAFLPIVFAYNGFNQASYILSEIDRPRRVFPRAVFIAVISISSLYILVNISYMVVVSKDEQMNGTKKVALMFLIKFMPETRARHLYGAITAISSLGNIIGMTFSAARVKQEVAKEGVLPFPKFFGETYFEDDAVPIGALLLHWIWSILLILVTWPMESSGTYKFFVSLTSYTVDAFFSTFLGVGMLYLRFKDQHWRGISGTKHFVSVLSAGICVISNGYILIASWFPPTHASPTAIKALVIKYYPWFLVPTVGWSVLAFSVGYWLVFKFGVPQIGYRRGCDLVVERHPHFDTRFGYTVQALETVERIWVPRGVSAPT